MSTKAARVFSVVHSSDLNSGSRNTFVVKAQCEPKGLGVNTAESVKVADAIRRIEDVLAKQDGLPVSLLLVLAAGALSESNSTPKHVLRGCQHPVNPFSYCAAGRTF